MSEQPSSTMIPPSPYELIVEVLNAPAVGEFVDTDWLAVRILDAFEEHDIDVTWRPAAKATGEL